MGPEKYLDVNGIRTRYFELGAGPTVIFFHGGDLGSATDARGALDWLPIFHAAAKTVRAVAVDRLGHGETNNPRSSEEYTMAASIDHAARFLRVLNKGPYHLVGHSSGGFLVTRLSLEFPDLVSSCVVADGVALYPGIGREHIVLRSPPLPYHSRESIRWVCERQCYRRDSVTDEWVDQMFATAHTEKNREAVRRMNDESLKDTVYLPGLSKQLGPTHRQLLETGMPCPTLLTWSLDDPIGDMANSRLLVEMFQHKQPRTEVRYFNKTGHYSFREQPKVFSHMLNRYLGAFS